MKDKKELLEEIQQLEMENDELRAAIRKIDDKEMFETVRIYTSIYRDAFYRKIPIRYLETVFYSHKNLLLKHASGCFIERILDTAYENFQHLGKKELVMHIPMYCSNVKRIGNKTVFSLSDPYRTINTLPISSLSEEEAFYCQGRMLVVKLLIPEDHRAKKAFELRGFVPMKMSLTNITGKEPPTNYNTLFTQYKDVNKESDAISALNTVERYYNSHSDTHVLRVNDLTLRIIDGRKKIALFFEKNQLWYGEEISTCPITFSSDILGQDNIWDDDYNNFLFKDENLL